MSSTERPLRKDAQRNRANVLDAARAAFTQSNADVPLESIARDAGVGIGTLYRHFPTREALVEAVYAVELDEVTGVAPALLDKHPPDVALRAWMQRYAVFVANKRGMIDTLRAGWDSGRIKAPTTRERITGTIARFLDAGAAAGTLRSDADPGDITALLLGVLLASATDEDPAQRERLLDLVLDAARRQPEQS